MKYRVEQKYMITEDQMAYLKLRLSSVMQPDRYARDGMYRIRSLYFDDWWDSYLEDNEAGNYFREKYRIRTYNNDLTGIYLEIKAKESGYTSKRKEPLTQQECRELMESRVPDVKQTDGDVKKKLYALMQTRGLHPAEIVEYERIPLVEPNGNVRVTFDCYITGTSETSAFFEEYLPGIPLLPTGQHVLEVKYDEFLPDTIKQILNEVHLHKTSFSKYYYARRNPSLSG